jgi:hypothetical protein
VIVKPATPEMLIPDPEAAAHERWLPAEGREVPDTEYWRRLLRDGDVVIVTDAKKKGA